MTTESDTARPAASGRRAAVSVAAVMVGVALVSVFVVAVFNYVSTRSLLNGAAEKQLADFATSRGVRIEEGLHTIGAFAETVAADKGVVRAMGELSDGYYAIESSLGATQTEELMSAYELGIASLVPPGVEPPPAEEIFPVSERARYLQYWYIAENPEEDRSELVDAADGSAYSAAHAVHHPMLRAMSDGLGLGDMLLIDAETSSVVYSVDKRAEFGTDLALGPHSESALATAVLEQLSTVGVDEAVLVDFEPYLPAGGEPLLFAAASIRDGGRIVGAVALQVPNELLNLLTTGRQGWESDGLGETGELYVVGADGLMRSDSRLWLEDPDAYLDALAEAGYGEDIADRTVAYGTTVLVQPVDTEPVEAALDGDVYADVTENYLERDTVTVAGPLDAGGLEWVVVADVATEEAYAPLRRYTRNLLVVALILVPIVAGLAVFISRKLLRPIGPITEASQRVRRGSLDVALPDFGRDEYGDIAAKFNDVIETLREQEAELQAAEDETTELLMSVMPSELADQVRRGGRGVAEAVRNATLVAVRATEPSGADLTQQEALAEHTVAISTGITDIAKRHGADLLRSSAAEHLYATGLKAPGEESGEAALSPEARAVAFAVEVRDWIGGRAEAAGLSVEFRGGLASGDVVAGVVGTGRIAFSVWGTPRRRAAELVSVAGQGQILVDPAVAGKIGHEWLVEPVAGLVDLKGDPLDGWRLFGPRTEAPAARED